MQFLQTKKLAYDQRKTTGGDTMKKNYIISRYSGTKREIKFNVRVARLIARKVLDEGFIPIVPHIYFTQFLDDRNHYERTKGITVALNLLRESDRATVVIIDGQISEGMKEEIKCANELGMTVQVLNYTKAGIKKLLRKSGV